MSYLSLITKSRQARPRRTVLYGVNGIGKSTWAASWPNPIFLPTEDGIGDLDVPAFPIARTIQDAWIPLEELAREKTEFQTVVIDTIDWLEHLMKLQVAVDKKVKDFSLIDYGKGYTALEAKMYRLLRVLDAIRDNGMHVILLGHSESKMHTPPESAGYLRYSLKLEKGTSSLLYEWADEVLFTNYEIFTVSDDESWGKERKIGAGVGARTLWTTQLPAHIAKNRLQLPPRMPLDFSQYAPYLHGRGPAASCSP